MFLELAILFALTLVNGVLAMSELAIVSSRSARLQVLADGGSRGARIAMRLAADPGRFLSSVQIGITLVGILAGAFSGATLGVRLTDTLVAAGMAPAMAGTLGVGGVVVGITYLSLVFGELVPKQIALRAPEAAAVRIAPLLAAISILAAPVVWVLDRSGRVVLALLGQSGSADRGMTDEEVKLVLSEARTAGVIEEAETEMIAGVMRIADRSARGLMTPRREVEVIDLSDEPATILRRMRESRRSRLPVRDGDEDSIIGVLQTRDVLDSRPKSIADLRNLLLEAPVVRDGMAALEVIAALRRAPGQIVLVYDEYGHFEGIVTPMDVLEAITGGFLDADEAEEPKIVTRADGSYLVAGWMPADEFAHHVGLALPADRDYETVAGLVLDAMGALPETGATVTVGGFRIEVVDLDGRRIDKLLVSRPD